MSYPRVVAASGDVVNRWAGDGSEWRFGMNLRVGADAVEGVRRGLGGAAGHSRREAETMTLHPYSPTRPHRRIRLKG